MKKGILFFSTFALMGLFINLNAQRNVDIEKMTQEEVLSIPIEQLADLPLEDLMKLADKFCFHQQ